MNLLRFELQKLCSKKAFWGVLILVFCGNLLLFFLLRCPVDSHQNALHHKETEILSQMQEYPQDEAMEILNRKYEEIGLVLDIAQDYLNSGQNEEVFSSLLADAEKKFPGFTEQYGDSPLLTDPEEANRYWVAISHVLDQYQALENYRSFLSSISQRAEELSGIGVFSEENSFAYRNIQKTEQDFAHLQGLPVTAGGSPDGLEAFSRYYLTDFLALFLILFDCTLLLSSEEKRGMRRLIRSTRRGGAALTANQLGALFLAGLGSAALLYGSNILCSAAVMGFGDLGRFVQSMDPFRNLPFALTVWQYLLVFLGGKLLAVCAAMAVCAAFFHLFGNGKAAILLFSVVCALSFLAWRFFPSQSVWAGFKYLSPFGLFDVYQNLCVYRNLNFFGYPVSLSALWLIVSVLLFLAGSLVSLLSQKWELELPFAIPQRKRKSKTGAVSLLRHELYKSIIGRKGWVCLALAVVWCVSTTSTTPYNAGTWEDQCYTSYYYQVSGPFTPEKEAFLLAEQKKFEEIPGRFDQLAEEYQQGLMSQEEYLDETQRLTYDATFQSGFDQIMKQYDSLKELESRGISGRILHKTSVENLLSMLTEDHKRAVVFLLLLILAVTGLTAYDYESGLRPLIQSTEKGYRRLYWTKAGLAAGYGVGFFMLVWLPRWLTYFFYNPPMDWQAPVQSLKGLENFSASLTIGQTVLLTMGYQIVCAALMGTAVLFLTQLLKKAIPSIAAGALIFIAPVLLSWLTVLEENGWFAVPLTGGALLPFVKPLFVLISPLSVLREPLTLWIWLFWPVLGIGILVTSMFVSRRKN